MKISIIMTGGTIGSATGNTLTPDARAANNLIAQLRGQPESNNTELTVTTPLAMLSENMTERDLSVIVSDARNAAFGGAEGVIITHGSDTLDFTAATLALTLCDTPVPVVLVAAAAPTDSSPLALTTLTDAVTFCREKRRGVFAAFTNNGEPTKIHLAAALLPARLHDDYVDSVRPYGYVQDGRFFSSGAPTAPKNATPFPFRLDRNVLLLHVHALQNFERISLDNVRAIVALPYHSGTVCTVGGDTDFNQLSVRAAEAGIPVVFASCRPRKTYYEGTPTANVIRADLTVSMTMALTMLLLGNGRPLTQQAYNDATQTF